MFVLQCTSPAPRPSHPRLSRHSDAFQTYATARAMADFYATCYYMVRVLNGAGLVVYVPTLRQGEPEPKESCHGDNHQRFAGRSSRNIHSPVVIE